MKKLIAGNWKMRGDSQKLRALSEQICRDYKGRDNSATDLLLAPPFAYLSLVGDIIRGSSISLAGQDCHEKEEGAYTGDVSASMLLDIGCDAVILGHSERREGHQENADLIGKKITAAFQAGLKVILCVGESGPQREEGQFYEGVKAQIQASLARGTDMRSLWIAYEPLWAIGTGKRPSVEEITEMHENIAEICKTWLDASQSSPKILYGGSVTPDCAASILALDVVDGVLVGGASFRAESFLAIEAAAPKKQ